MKIPELSLAQAKELIETSNDHLLTGTAKSGRKKRPIKSCPECGVKFATNAFDYCPMCVIRNAESVEIQDEDTFMARRQRRIDGIDEQWKPKSRINWGLRNTFIVIGCFVAWYILYLVTNA